MQTHDDLTVFLCFGGGAVGSQDVLSPPFQTGNVPGAVTLSAAKAMASVPMGREENCCPVCFPRAKCGWASGCSQKQNTCPEEPLSHEFSVTYLDLQLNKRFSEDKAYEKAIFWPFI